MYKALFEDIVSLQESLTSFEEDIETTIHEKLKNDSIVDKENDNQNFLYDSGSSTMIIQSETNHENNSGNVSKSTTQNSMECPSNEVIDVPSDSDNDTDYYNNTSDSSDVSIIATVKAVAKDNASSNSQSHKIDIFEPLVNVLNSVPVATSSSDREPTSVSSKTQNRSEIKVIELNNNEVSYTNTVSGMKELLENPKPGCSKDSDDMSSKLNDGASNLDELLKDARLIHALLPRFSNRLIYRTLCNNQFAKNRIELTLWDLLPVVRPLAQYVQKRKSSDEICIVECKKKSSSLQKEVDTEIVIEIEKKKLVMDDDIEKLKDRTFASLIGEIDRVEKNVPKATVSNDTNNDIDQPSMMPVKTNLALDEPTLAEPILAEPILPKPTLPAPTLDELKYMKCDNINKCVARDFKKSVSSEVGSKTKEVQSTKNSKVKKKCKFYSDNTATLPPPVRTVLQPAKFTIKSNASWPNEVFYKPPTILSPILSPPTLLPPILPPPTLLPPILSPPTLLPPILSPPKLFVGSQLTKLQQSRTSSMQRTKLNAPIVFSADFNARRVNNSSIVRLPDTSSNDKKASYIDVTISPDLTWKPRRIIPQGVPDLSKDMETDKLTKVCTTRVTEPLYSQPSSSTTVHILYNDIGHDNKTLNISDHQTANSSKVYNFDQETDEMKAFQIYDKKDKKQQHSSYYDRHKADTIRKVSENTAKDTDTEVKIMEKSKLIEKDADKIILNERANKLYIKLIPMFPSVKTFFIKQLCRDYTKNFDSKDDTVLLEYVIDHLLKYGHENLEKIKPLPVEPEEPDPSYDKDELYADLLTIFPEADPVYLRHISEVIHGDHQQIKEFVQKKLEKPDYPTRAQYLAKKKITEQQKQYTTDFQVQKFLEIFPDPFSYFEDNKRNCQFNPHAIDFLKYYFSKLRVNTLVKTYSQFMYNLSLTAKVLEALNPDLKTKRQCNKMTLTEDIPFLQECAFIQHKTELKKYLDEVETKEKQEFNELKANNGLLECQCCYDNECMPSKCSTCEDGHVFCNLCIIRGTDMVLGEGNTRVDCLLKCGSEFPISVLQRVLSPTKFSILLCKRQEAEIIAAGVEGLESCPFCHFASIPPPEDKIFKCLNPECMKESCRLCKELNHIPLKCNEKKTESARLYLEEKMTEALIRKCYRCNRMFFKEEGCNKMTCVCGAQMCYICDKPVTDYKHFQGQGAGPSNLCPLWSDDRRMNAESVIKVCQETVKQIKEKDPEIEINVDALLPKLPPKSNGPHDDIVYNAMVREAIMRPFL